jgi:hypothetical protein
MFRNSHFRLVSRAGWQGRTAPVISTILILALAIVTVALALGLALVLIPVVVVGLLVAAWRLRALRAALARAIEGSGRTWEHDEPRTIETDYSGRQRLHFRNGLVKPFFREQ